jgi:hypothetical protein
MPQVGLEPKIPMFEWAKTVHALDRAANAIGSKYGWKAKNINSGIIWYDSLSINFIPPPQKKIGADPCLNIPPVAHGDSQKTAYELLETRER